MASSPDHHHRHPDLSGRVAIVTGGSRGIGREVCLHLAQHGASVVVCYAGDAQAASDVLGLINMQTQTQTDVAGGQEEEQKAKVKVKAKAIAVKGDVSKEADVKAIFDAAIQAFGHVNIVINLAGIFLSSYPTLEQTSSEDWERTMSVNATGTFLVLKEAAQRIVAGGKGRIVTTSSSMVHVLKPGYGAYVASKAAVETLTKIMAKELRGRRITANCVAPGPVATDMFYAGKDEALVESFRDAPPLQRLGTPQDIAPLILFLVSDAGEWVNGQVIQANGGLAI